MHWKFCLSQSCNGAAEFDDGVVAVWAGAVSWASLCLQAKAKNAFLSRLARIKVFAIYIKIAAPAFCQYVFCIDLFGMVIDEPTNAVVSFAGLFICGCRIDYVSV